MAGHAIQAKVHSHRQGGCIGLATHPTYYMRAVIELQTKREHLQTNREHLQTNREHLQTRREHKQTMGEETSRVFIIIIICYMFLFENSTTLVTDTKCPAKGSGPSFLNTQIYQNSKFFALPAG